MIIGRKIPVGTGVVARKNEEKTVEAEESTEAETEITLE